MKIDEILEQLLEVLHRETELYRAMSSVMDKEKSAAIQSELIALNEAGIEKSSGPGFKLDRDFSTSGRTLCRPDEAG